MTALSVLAIWMLCVLLVPKRAMASLPERLRATARADRTFVFGPPPRLGESFALSALGETFRLIELGIPIYMACLWAEARGRRQRLTTPISGASPLPPAPKARPSSRRVYRMPPIEWTREWEASLQRMANKADTPAVSVGSVLEKPAEPPHTACKRLAIRSLGTFQLMSGDTDLTARLLRAPTLSFIWLFLLTHAAARPGARVHRQALAEEAFPGIDAEQQRARLRGRLSDLQHEPFPAVLAERIKIDGDLLWLEIETDEFDVARLRGTSEEFAGTGLLTEVGVRVIQAALADYGGEYLPIWEEVERQTTSGRGSASDPVRAVRAVAEDFHIQLMLRLARHHQARRNDGDAIPLLEEVLRRRPDREDVAQLLTSVYRETGQMTRARQMEMTYRPEFAATERRSETE